MLMLFLAFVSAYIVRHGIGGWMPGTLPPILWLNTAILALSGLALERARAIDRRGGSARRWVWVVLGLGIAFVAGQLEAWFSLRAMGVGIATTPHSSFFYLLTGAHAAHVAGGLVGLAAVATWPARGVHGLGIGTALRVIAIYWHFLFLLWLMLFAVLSIWR
jgi:cytochrome c oxidase subunit 3